MIGKIFNNRYQIIEKLGAGGTAIVYRGHDMLLNRAVTIKILRDEHAGNSDLVRRFQHEAQAVASLSHPNIVSVYDVGFEENMHYIVMEFVEGESLKEYINRCGVLKLQEACNIITQILAGVQHAHEHGIIHRDLKPHNILLGKDGRAKVTDFGIAVALSDVTLTYSASSRIMGSVHYISPEQVQGLPVTDKSDIYSLGVVFYEMLTGRLPFVGETPISIAMQHVQGELLLPHQINPEVPMGLSYVVMRAMRKNPETRYESCTEMGEAVRSAYMAALAGSGDEPPETAQALVQPGEAAILPAEKVKKTTLPSDDETTPEPRKLNKNRIILLAAVGVLVVALLLLTARLMGLISSDNDKAVVPNLIGLTQAAAEAELTNEGLLFSVTTASSDKYAAGLVMEQDIAADSEIGKGRTVGIVVSTGEQTVSIPDLSHSSRRLAEMTLGNLGLMASITEEYNEEVPSGQLIMQSPEAGEAVKPGSSVSLLFSLGAEPIKFTMKDLCGKTIEEATSYIDANQLKLVNTISKESYDYDKGIICDQSIAVNSQAQTGDEITLTISSGPGPVPKIHYVSYFLEQDYDDMGVPVEKIHRVVISVSDSRNTRDVFDQELSGGSNIAYDVQYYGSGTITITVDGEPVQSYAVK